MNSERELEYITSINTTAGFTGWLELNLTKCLTTWVAFPDSNKGIYLSVHPVNRAGRLKQLNALCPSLPPRFPCFSFEFFICLLRHFLEHLRMNGALTILGMRCVSE